MKIEVTGIHFENSDNEFIKTNPVIKKIEIEFSVIFKNKDYANFQLKMDAPKWQVIAIDELYDIVKSYIKSDLGIDTERH